MKYLTHELKGTVGYIKKQTVFEIIKTIVLFAMAFGIFFIGYFTLGTKKSLWSVFAVLALLPASKSLVSVIMFLRYKSLSNEVLAKLSDSIKDIPALYENVITTSEKSYFVPAFIYVKGSLIGYTDHDKDAVNKLSAHLENVLKNGGHKDVVIKIYSGEAEFIKRCRELSEKFTASDFSMPDALFNTIKAVSL